MNIYLPKKVNVGYQNRDGTYTGRLAYVTYYDNNGKLRKKSSWEAWRDHEIPSEELENVPIEGFVLNKKVGDYRDSYYEGRRAWIRVYDPRGFEFEITVENLLWILENCTSDVGKGLCGQFVYGWSGKDLLLVPCDSPDYKEISKISEKINCNSKIGAKNLIVGAKYLTHQGRKLVYMGKLTYWDEGYYYIDENNQRQYVKKCNYRERKKYTYDSYCIETKRFYFYDIDSDQYNKYVSVSAAKLIECLNENCADNFADIFDKICEMPCFCRPDEMHYDLIEMTFEQFRELCMAKKNSSICYKIVGQQDGILHKYAFTNENCKQNMIRIGRFNTFNVWKPSWDEKNSPYELEHNYSRFKSMPIQVPIEQVYKDLKPVKLVEYLENGRIYNTSSVFDTDKFTTKGATNYVCAK